MEEFKGYLKELKKHHTYLINFYNDRAEEAITYAQEEKYLRDGAYNLGKAEAYTLVLNGLGNIEESK